MVHRLHSKASMSTKLTTLDTADLTTTTGGAPTGRWLANHPYRADNYLANHPVRAQMFAANHPFANARMHALAG